MEQGFLKPSLLWSMQCRPHPPARPHGMRAQPWTYTGVLTSLSLPFLLWKVGRKAHLGLSCKIQGGIEKLSLCLIN